MVGGGAFGFSTFVPGMIGFAGASCSGVGGAAGFSTLPPGMIGFSGDSGVGFGSTGFGSAGFGSAGFVTGGADGGVVTIDDAAGVSTGVVGAGAAAGADVCISVGARSVMKGGSGAGR